MDQEKRPGQNLSSSNSSSIKARPAQPTLETARVLRLAERLHLSTETMEKIKAKIFGPLARDVLTIEARGSSEPSVFEEQKLRSGVAPENYPQIETIDTGEIARLKKLFAKSEPTVQAAPSQPEAKPAIADRAPRKDEALEDEILLRKKIEASPSFAAFRGEAWRLFEKYPRPDIAGRLVELALMYGSALELEETLKHVELSPGEYFPLIAPSTREQILIRLWQAARHSFMNEYYFRKDLILKLLPIERWYIAWSLIEQSKFDHLYRWYKRHEQELNTVQKQFASRLQKSDSEFQFAVGSSAFRMNDEDLALKLLEAIPKSAPEFSQAIDLLLEVRVERDERGLSSYEARLSREMDWNARLGLFDTFLLRAKKNEQLAPRDRAALNALLIQPLKWFPDSPEAVHLVAELLLQYADLDKQLPNILRVFHDHTLQFQKPSFEHALWTPVLRTDFPQDTQSWYWHSIALVHEFALGLGQDEKKLWQARELYDEAASHEGQGKSLSTSWNELHRALVQWISKTERLDEPSRKRLLMMARLCGETREISEEDIKQYLTHVNEPNFEVLATMEKLAFERKQSDLELFILSRKAEVLHHTNQSLARIWEIGVQQGKNDLCWRTATLLQVRGHLGPELEKPWLISGEKRREYTFHNISDAHLRQIFAVFDGNERKLVEAIATVGPLIPELLASLNPHLVPQKRLKAVSKTETEVHEFLDSVTCMPQPRKSFSLASGGLWQTRPPFFASLTDGKWAGVFIGLTQRLGLNSWDWDLGLLNQQIEALLPRMTRSSDTLQAGKVGRWLRSLTPVQRKAWYDLAQVSKKFENEKAQEILGRFLAILTTTIYQDHIGALATLERVRAPLRLRWDLENWIVSFAYGDIRKSLNSSSITRFPDNVYRLAVLSPEPPRMRS